jgi:hypothetical protein
MISECIDVMENGWGFQYKGFHLIWHKYKTDPLTSKMGVGFYTASNTEILVMGVRGTRYAHYRGINRRIDAPSAGHSQKPEITYTMIRAFCIANDLGEPTEMFARCTSRQGWKYYLGDQHQLHETIKPGDVIKPTFTTPIPLTKRLRIAATPPSEEIIPLTFPHHRPKYNALFVWTQNMEWIRGIDFTSIMNPDSVLVFHCTSETVYHGFMPLNQQVNWYTRLYCFISYIVHNRM